MPRPVSRPHTLPDRFSRLAHVASRAAGHYVTFLVAVAIIVAWAATGPLFGWSETWQLVINTGTTIITFLMVFLIQNTQNRDSTAIHLKIDELILSNLKARNRLINLENLSERELEDLRLSFKKLADRPCEEIDMPNIG
jgi:low affinity Fe/Cu permease